MSLITPTSGRMAAWSPSLILMSRLQEMGFLLMLLPVSLPRESTNKTLSNLTPPSRPCSCLTLCFFLLPFLLPPFLSLSFYLRVLNSPPFFCMTSILKGFHFLWLFFSGVLGSPTQAIFFKGPWVLTLAVSAFSFLSAKTFSLPTSREPIISHFIVLCVSLFPSR